MAKGDGDQTPKQDQGWQRSGSVRNSRGQFAKARDVRTVERQENSANRGNQTVISDRYETEGVVLNMATMQHWLQQPWIYNAVQAQTDAWQVAANDSAITRNTYYGQIVYNNRPELGPVGVVFCDNYPSVIDDAKHGTLLKVMARPNLAEFNDMLSARSDEAAMLNQLADDFDNSSYDDGYGDDWQGQEYAW